jgi:hypothetical protein
VLIVGGLFKYALTQQQPSKHAPQEKILQPVSWMLFALKISIFPKIVNCSPINFKDGFSLLKKCLSLFGVFGVKGAHRDPL